MARKKFETDQQYETKVEPNAGTRPYEVYTALLTQIDDNAPTTYVLENTFQSPFTYTRISEGQYRLISVNTFTDKTYFSITPNNYSNEIDVRMEKIDSSTIYIYTTLGGNAYLSDNVLINCPIEIRVYNP